MILNLIFKKHFVKIEEEFGLTAQDVMNMRILQQLVLILHVPVIQGTICALFPDLFTWGFNSLRRPGYNNIVKYGRIAGSFTTAQNSMFYPAWAGISDYVSCDTGKHFMINVNRDAWGNTAWGCYTDTYASASAMCCKDNQ